MPYVRFTIHLRGGKTRAGVRRVPDPIILDDIRLHSLHLTEEAPGRREIEVITLTKVLDDDRR